MILADASSALDVATIDDSVITIVSADLLQMPAADADSHPYDVISGLLFVLFSLYLSLGFFLAWSSCFAIGVPSDDDDSGSFVAWNYFELLH